MILTGSNSAAGQKHTELAALSQYIIISKY